MQLTLLPVITLMIPQPMLLSPAREGSCYSCEMIQLLAQQLLNCRTLHPAGKTFCVILKFEPFTCEEDFRTNLF